ncbi:MAG TPA: chloride channel protein [Bacteroidetes bacterium]|nr:chloride channel protein [Bacteroidota bacterium]
MKFHWSTLRIYERLIVWVGQKLSRNQFILFSAVLVGLSAGIAAIVLKTAVHYVRRVILLLAEHDWQNMAYILGPLLGIVSTVAYVKYGLKGDSEKGVASVLYAIKKKFSLVTPHKMYSQLISSSITVGLGGSAGLESPIVVTGAAIGSNYGRVYRLIHKERTLMLACGAAAGIAAVFNAPVAGVIFALEAIMTEATISAFIPIIIASVSGALVSMIVLNEEILFSYKEALLFDYHNVPLYILFSILTGIMSVNYGRMSWKINLWNQKADKKPWWRAVRGGLFLAILIFIFPSLFGEGYESITELMHGNAERLYDASFFARFIDKSWAVLLFIGLTGFIKVVATSITVSSGGNGGNFAPSLFVGAYIGFFFSRLVNMLGIADLNETNFVIAGMAGLLSGIMYTPLTGIFLIAELTGGYDLMIPIMLVSAVSYAIARSFERYPVDKRALMESLSEEENAAEPS